MRRGDDIAWPLRAWFAMEVLFGVAALLSIGRAPDQTATNFAWPIKPTVTAAVLAGFYFSLVPVVVLALLSRRWASVRVVVLPAVAFTTAELIATFLHWDKFSVGTLPFNIWLASYLIPPAVFGASYLWHERHRQVGRPSRPLPPALRTVLLVVGGFLTLDALFAFVYPAWFTRSFPWTLTPLTARALCGWLILLGSLMLSAARENDRERARLASPFLLLVLPALAVQVLRYRHEVDPSVPRLWIALVLFAVIAAAGAGLARGDRRAGESGAGGQTRTASPAP